MNKYNLEILNNSKSVCIISHINPDVDALASIITLKAFVKEQFKIKQVDIFAEYSTLPAHYFPLISKENLNPTPKKYDTAIMLDAPNHSRLGKFENLFVGAAKKIVIDHHATNDFGGDLNIVEYVSSTCEIIYYITKQYKYKLSKTQCENIYAGIITDTNNLTVGNISGKTFQAVAEIADFIDTNSIYTQYFSNNTLKTMQILAKAIENIEVFDDGQILFSHITKSFSKKHNIVPNDYDGVINWLSTISKNKFVCLVHPKNNTYYVSLRARKGYDVAKIAKNNGGGGHTGAAAFMSNNSILSIKEKVLKEFRLQIK